MKAYLILCYVLWSLMLGMIGCTIPSDKEIYQSSRNEVLKVQDGVKEIIGDEVLIGSIARLNILNDYLLIKDAKSQDTLIHIFNKHTFEYVRGVGIWGEGPDEITSLGKLVVDEKNNIFHAPDLGKNKILAYEMDSVIANPFWQCPKYCVNEKTGFRYHLLYLDSVFKYKNKLVHNQAPIMNRLCPLLLNFH